MSGDAIFGIHAKALQMREQRASILASNLVNASTPEYKARDFDFAKVMQRARQANSTTDLKTTHLQHIGFNNKIAGADLQYRTPMQPSPDGNTVDGDIERVQFMENAMQYQVNLTFVRGKVRGLMSAIRGD